MTSMFASITLVLILTSVDTSHGDEPEPQVSNLSEPPVMNRAILFPIEETTNSESTTRSKPNTSESIQLIDKGTVSKKQYETFKFVIDLILKPIVCFVGVVLNVIGICVLLQPQLRHGFYVYLATLAVADTSYLLCGLLRSGIKLSILLNVEMLTFEGSVMPYIDIGFEIPCCKIGAYCIILFSLDRLLAVAFPLKVKDMFLSKYSKFVCPSLVFVVFVFYLPKILNLGWSEVVDGNRTRTRLKQIAHEDGSAMATVMSIYQTTNDVIFTYLPPIFICIINGCIIVHIYRIRKARKRLYADKSKMHLGRNKLLVTVFIISSFFLAVYIPMIFSRNLSILNSEYSLRNREHYVIMMIPSLVSFAWSINAAIDFIVYSATSETFRRTLKTVCCKKRHKSKRQSLLSSPTFSRSQSNTKAVKGDNSPTLKVNNVTLNVFTV